MQGRSLNVAKLQIILKNLEQAANAIHAANDAINKGKSAQKLMPERVNDLLPKIDELSSEIQKALNGAKGDLTVRDDMNIANELATIDSQLSEVYNEFYDRNVPKVADTTNPVYIAIENIEAQRQLLGGSAETLLAKKEKEKEKEKETPEAKGEDAKIAALTELLELTEQVANGLESIAENKSIEGSNLQNVLRSAANALQQATGKLENGEFAELRRPDNLPGTLYFRINTANQFLISATEILTASSHSETVAQTSKAVNRFTIMLSTIQEKVNTYEAAKSPLNPPNKEEPRAAKAPIKEKPSVEQQKQQKAPVKKKPSVEQQKQQKENEKQRKELIEQRKAEREQREQEKEGLRARIAQRKKVLAQEKEAKLAQEKKAKPESIATQEKRIPPEQVKQKVEEIKKATPLPSEEQRIPRAQVKEKVDELRKREEAKALSRKSGQRQQTESPVKTSEPATDRNEGIIGDVQRREIKGEVKAEHPEPVGTEGDAKAEHIELAGIESDAKGEHIEAATSIEGKVADAHETQRPEAEEGEGNVVEGALEADASAGGDVGGGETVLGADAAGGGDVGGGENVLGADAAGGGDVGGGENVLGADAAGGGDVGGGENVLGADAAGGGDGGGGGEDEADDPELKRLESELAALEDEEEVVEEEVVEEEEEEDLDAEPVAEEYEALTKERIKKLAYRAYAKTIVRDPTPKEVEDDPDLDGQKVVVQSKLRDKERYAIFNHVLNREDSYDKLINFYAHQIAIIERDNNPDLEKLEAIVKKCEELRVQFEIYERSLLRKQRAVHWTDTYGTPHTWNGTWRERLIATQERIDKLDNILMARLDKRLSAIKLAGNTQIAHFSDKGEAIVPNAGESLRDAINRKVAEYVGPGAIPNGHIAVDYAPGSKVPYIPSTERYADAARTQEHESRITGRWNDDHTKARASVHIHTGTGAVCELHRNAESSKGSKTRRLGYILPDDFILKSAMAELQEFQKFVKPGPTKPVMALRGAMSKQEIEAYLIAGKILGIPVLNQTRTKVNISYFNSWTAWKTQKAEHRLNKTLANEGKSEALSWMSRGKSEKLEEKTIKADKNADDQDIPHRRLPRKGGSD